MQSTVSQSAPVKGLGNNKEYNKSKKSAPNYCNNNVDKKQRLTVQNID
jgi:hypothetical protein